jgi:hypothetical protein
MSEDSLPEAGRRTQSAEMVRFGGPHSVDPEIWKQLNPHTNRLTKLRLQKAREKFRREVEAETRQIHFDNRGNANGMAIPRAMFRMQLKKADNFAKQQYSIFRDVWLGLGGIESAAFIRTMSWMAIQCAFGTRAASVAYAEERRFVSTGGLHPRVSPETVLKGFGDLKNEWRDRLEIKALEWEAKARRRTLAALIQTPPMPPPDRENSTPKPASGGGDRSDQLNSKPLMLRYRSGIKRAILGALTRNPKATDAEICRALDVDGGEELPDNWKSRSADRLFFDAYSNAGTRHKIEIAISRIRRDLRDRGLLA